MAVSTFEGIVENGHIQLQGNVTLPDKTRVYVVIPAFETTPQAHVRSPRLVRPEQAIDFVKLVIKDPTSAEL
jgi:hypothetical protein